MEIDSADNIQHTNMCSLAATHLARTNIENYR